MNGNPSDMYAIFDSSTLREIEEINRLEHGSYLSRMASFKSSYRIDSCYLCGDSFETMDRSSPCLHWLLGRCDFKKGDFPAVYVKFDYQNISTFLRWCSHEESPFGNSNDLNEERREKKILDVVIKWKNVEWAFDCSESDWNGHMGKVGAFPHYHFRMKIDDLPFLDFAEAHIPFSNRDYYLLSLQGQ